MYGEGERNGVSTHSGMEASEATSGALLTGQARSAMENLSQGEGTSVYLAYSCFSVSSLSRSLSLSAPGLSLQCVSVCVRGCDVYVHASRLAEFRVLHSPGYR